jgi:hypothetical protein
MLARTLRRKDKPIRHDITKEKHGITKPQKMPHNPAPVTELGVSSPGTTNMLLATYKEKLMEAEAQLAKLDLQLQEETVNNLGKFKPKPPLYNNEKPKRRMKRNSIPQPQPPIPRNKKKIEEELATKDAELDAAIRRENPNYVNNESVLVAKLINEFKSQIQEQQHNFMIDIRNMLQDVYTKDAPNSNRGNRENSLNNLEKLEKNIEMQQLELENEINRGKERTNEQSWYIDDGLNSGTSSDGEEYPPVKNRLSSSVSSSFLEKISVPIPKKSSRSVESTIRSSIPSLPSIYTRPLEVSTEWIPV